LPRKNEGWDISAFLGILAVLTPIAIYILSLNISDAQKYFGVTIVLFVLMFVYFEKVKKYPTSRSR
jgi:hypothetical protein